MERDGEHAREAAAALKLRREALGLTQEQLAQRLRYTTGAISRWEQAKRRIPAHIELLLQQVEAERQAKGKGG